MSISFEANRFATEETQAPWLAHYPVCTPAHLEYPEQPVWWLLEQTARRFPQRTAIRYFKESMTYDQLLERAR